MRVGERVGNRNSHSLDETEHRKLLLLYCENAVSHRCSWSIFVLQSSRPQHSSTAVSLKRSCLYCYDTRMTSGEGARRQGFHPDVFHIEHSAEVPRPPPCAPVGLLNKLISRIYKGHPADGAGAA
ncbi:hypothetical protein EVAR_103980_1 [Eumeta japonica]|uniref:Uncharacterized protein n=1 Tax=Eumeta variegata TaxID=151549 RepID=A0A4C1XXV2_EUMVA|nr:hypothetical protein EVAR_103980_1 [Eumeta japonica]